MSITYDRAVIERGARRLYSAARSLRVQYALIGAVIGFIVAALIARQQQRGDYMPVEIGLAIVGAGLGYWLSAGRAEQLRLQAQQMLCLAAIEANTRRGADGGRVERAA